MAKSLATKHITSQYGGASITNTLTLIITKQIQLVTGLVSLAQRKTNKSPEAFQKEKVEMAKVSFSKYICQAQTILQVILRYQMTNGHTTQAKKRFSCSHSSHTK